MPRPDTALLMPPGLCSSAVLSRLGGKEDPFPLGTLPCSQALGQVPMAILETSIVGEKSVPAAELVWARAHGQEPGTGGDSPRLWLQPQADAGRGGSVAHGSRCQPGLGLGHVFGFLPRVWTYGSRVSRVCLNQEPP